MLLEQTSEDELFLRYSVEEETIKRKLNGYGISKEKRARLERRLGDLVKRLIPKVVSKIRDERKCR